MLSHELSAIRSNERAETYHSDATDGLGHSDVPHSEPIGSNERFGLTSSGNPIGSNDSRVSLEKISSEQSRLDSEADELCNDLKAETGYSSYADYLEAYIANHEGLDMLLDRLREEDPCSDEEVPPFTILDLFKDESGRLRVVPRFDDNIDSATRVVTSLRQPPANVTVQIVLWNSNYSLHKGTVNAFGPAFKLNPRFWGALCSKSRPQFDPRHIRMGGFVATVVRHYKPDELDAVPIVFIACNGWEAALERAVDEEIGDFYPIQDVITDMNTSFWGDGVLSALPRVPQSKKKEPTAYLRALKMCLDKEEEQADDVTKLIFKPLIPLLYLNVFSIRNRCEILRSKYRNLWWNAARMHDKDDKVKALPHERHRLREMVEESEDDLSYFRKYAYSQISVETLSDISWSKAEADLIQIHQEAGRLESQVRDYMQLQVGELALQESKKSIELSNQQIEEGKRVKICKLHDQAYNDVKYIDFIAVTVLAFVYVPLNLATSIFGMNLSEPNGSGKNISTFVCTALVALLTTGALWYVLKEVNNYLRWRKGVHHVQDGFTLGPRIGMLVWLQQHGHTGWMWESGAWWRLLINSYSRVWFPIEVGGRSACEIVSIYGVHGSHSAFDPFERRNKYTWKYSAKEYRRAVSMGVWEDDF